MSRVSAGTMTVAIFAVLIGLGGAYAVRQYLNQPVPVAETPPARAPRVPFVPLASADLTPGRVITLGDVALAQLTPEQQKKLKVPGESMTNPQQIIGRVLKNPIPKGRSFLSSDLYPQGMGPSIADRLKPGLRAVSVPITSVGSVAGWAGPGAEVDVMFRTLESEEIPETTVTLVENVEVLALDEASMPGTMNNNKRVTMITLAVSPQQATALKVVEARGELSLALRSKTVEAQVVPAAMAQGANAGVAQGATDGVTLKELLNIPEKRKPRKLEIYQGGAKSELTFEERAPKKDQRPIAGLPIVSNAKPATPVAPASSTTTNTEPPETLESQGQATSDN